jgi:3-phenylpropionate/trans-cinnamate dioxygenase ferredoxin subunit
MPYTRLLAAADIPAEKSHKFEHDGKPLLICHSAGAFFVIANQCSHAQEPLDCGRVRNGWVACPVHGARFDLATGAAMNPPATSPIATYPVRVVDGWIEADLG